jgi:hypothetical protein
VTNFLNMRLECKGGSKAAEEDGLATGGARGKEESDEVREGVMAGEWRWM